MGRDSTGNHLMLFEDGGGYCNRCEYYSPPEGTQETQEVHTVESTELEAGAIPSRKLQSVFVDMYGGKIEYDTTTREPTHVHWPVYVEGEHTGWKVVGIQDKTFTAKGKTKGADLFGMHIDGGRRLCIITEGEYDAVSAKQMLAEHGKDYRVVSLPQGALSHISKASHDFLSSFETIILALDMDEPGNEATSRITELFEPGKCKRAQLPAKDASDCLCNGLSQEFFSSLMSARTVTADGVVLGSDTWEKVLDAHHNPNGSGLPFPWVSLNDMSYGSRVGEVDTWTSGTGMGKSAVMRELIHNWSIVHGTRTGVLALEENLSTTILGQMSICANLPLHIPEVRASVSDEELREYWEMATTNDNLVCLDHWGSVEESRLIPKIRYLASGMGCQYMVLDHLSILVSEIANDGDERKNIDVIMTKLKRLTEELQIHISLVSHLNRPQGSTSFEEGATPSLMNLRGSGSIAQLSHNVYALSRNQQSKDPILRNTSKVTVLKNRFCGRTGDAGLLYYNTDTGRLLESTMTLEDYYNGSTGNVLSTAPQAA